MAQFGGGRVHPDPKTDTQLRAALAASQAQSDALSDQITDLTVEVDAINAQSGPITAVFDSTAVVGQAVRVSSAGHVDLANASSPSTAGVVGLVFTAATAGNNGEYIAGGRLTLANWTAITGSASLTAGSLYFLNTTNGALTTTAPTTDGQTVVQVGRALTANILLVDIKRGVLL